LGTQVASERNPNYPKADIVGLRKHFRENYWGSKMENKTDWGEKVV